MPQGLRDLAKTSKWFAEHGDEAAGASTRTRVGLGYEHRKPPAGGKDRDTAAALARPSPSNAPSFNKALQKAQNVAASSTGVGLSKYETIRQSLKVRQPFFYKISNILTSRHRSKAHLLKQPPMDSR